MAKRKENRVPVSERALFARINRALAKQNEYESLRRCRSDSRGYHSLGRYYILDQYRNAVIDAHVDLEATGRKVGAMADHEYLSEDE